MAWDWAEYRSFAERLRHSDSECDLRNAISRGYYFAHHRASEHLHSAYGTRMPNVDRHRWVISQFEMGSREEQIIALRLLDVRNLRNQADYDDQVSELQKKANLALSMVDRIDSALKKLNESQS